MDMPEKKTNGKPYNAYIPIWGLVYSSRKLNQTRAHNLFSEKNVVFQKKIWNKLLKTCENRSPKIFGNFEISFNLPHPEMYAFMYNY